MLKKYIILNLYSKKKHIHSNPVEEGFVEFSEQYYYSCACDYADLKVPVNVAVYNLQFLFYTQHNSIYIDS